MPPASSPSALRADAARNRERIVAAASEVFASRGLDASTAEIAERAGVGEGTLFRRFPSKDDLINAVIEDRMAGRLASVELALEDPDAGAALRRWLQESVARLAADQGFFEAAADRCLTTPGFQRLRSQILDGMAALLRRAQDAGEVRDDLTAQDLSFLVAAASATARVPLPGLRADVWKRYLALILDGMRPEGASPLRPAAPPRRLLEGSQE
jgi:AcrR family transcriptional regulator